MDHIVSFNNKELTVIRASWRQEKWPGRITHPDGTAQHHQFNSSCMTWESPYTRCLWERFIGDPEYYTTLYPVGMDSFMSYEHKAANTNIHFFPERQFYSQDGGLDYWENIASWSKQRKNSRPYMNYDLYAPPDIIDKVPIVLLNGPYTHKYYKKFKKFYEV